jgi:glycogen operon protein
MTLGVVINPYFDWEGDRHPNTPYNRTVIYEAHVKGLTQLHPEVPEEHRGTYAGLAHPAVIEHLQKIGITAIELMPVHQFIQDSTLLDQGLRNYWGYNTLSFFAPHAAYAAHGEGQQVQEFKGMVKAMHDAGIEVILDVVYNHTAEGNELGPTLSFKGIDNPAYYRLVEDDQRYYMDYTGTGNSLNVRHPHSVQLIMDSLRYWVTEMHVDGFRFDLAATLAREFFDVDKLATFFELVQQDPVVSQVKLIAEPWDIGPGGYQVGGFPPLWTEWNGAYRDTVRDFWRGEPSVGDFASRLAGSADYYEHSGRRPFASINFVTAHDGFTLRDLVSYNEKHNEANGEDNNDGESHNRSWNHGVEGPTDDPEVLELRARAQRNFITTLLLSQGVPMLLHGDELGRTQQGNNNTYAQDSELSWVHWDKVDQPLVEFTAAVARLRADHPTFRRKRFFTGTTVRTGDDSRLNDIVWLDLDATPMEGEDWQADGGAVLGMYLNGDSIPGTDPTGNRVVDDHFLLWFNAGAEAVSATLPSEEYSEAWDVVIDTGDSVGDDGPHPAGEVVKLAGRSVVVLRQHTAPQVEVDLSVAASIKAQSTNGN